MDKYIDLNLAALHDSKFTYVYVCVHAYTFFSVCTWFLCHFNNLQVRSGHLVVAKSSMQRAPSTLFTAKPLKNQYLSAKHVLFIIYQFYYLPINYFLKISACYISLERDFIAEYSAISLTKLLPLNHSIQHHLNLVPAGQLELLMAVNGKNDLSH